MRDPDKADFWQSYVKKVRPIAANKKRTVKKSSAKSEEKKLSVSRSPKMGGLTKPSQEKKDINVKDLVMIFDRQTERKLREGSINLEARLDLHGLTQGEAYAALREFMAEQIRLRSRMLLVITGKGRGGDGVLRKSLLGWLQSLPCAPYILSLRAAATRHGGAGAFYVVLRRDKGIT